MRQLELAGGPETPPKETGRTEMKTDVLIIGGGLAGLSLASGLQRAGCSYVVVENRRLSTRQVRAFLIANDALPVSES